MKKLIPLFALLSFLPSAMPQTMQLVTPLNTGSSQITLSAPARQVYPVLYPAESYTLPLEPGTNYFNLNPGWWTASIGVSAGSTYSFFMATNVATNNLLTLITNGPPAIVPFGMTTNIGLVYTNAGSGTLKTNLFCYTNGVLAGIQ